MPLCVLIWNFVCMWTFCGAEFTRFNWPSATGSRRIESRLFLWRYGTSWRNWSRAPNLLTVIRRRRGQLPIVGMVTRWGAFIWWLIDWRQLREHVQDLAAAPSDLQLTNTEWVKSRFSPLHWSSPTRSQFVYKQRRWPQYFSSKNGRTWSPPSLRRNGSALTSLIAAAMEKRESKLFDNDLFLLAVLVDARYRILLSEDQVERAKLGLWEVVRRTRVKPQAPAPI